MKRALFLLLLLSLATIPTQPAQPAQNLPGDLTELSLEELMNLEVISAAKREQRLSDAAAAIYVITQEDIHRSGATTIAEALRMAPGLHVARINANSWAVTSRGFNSRFSNKLLVLLDGRSVYTPLFSGVFWEVQDTLLEDIDRIEVIRGPAGTLWGANAVNGVINIITKSSKETQGGLLSGGGGDRERGFGSFRYGGKAAHASYRIFGKYFAHDGFSGAGGSDSDRHDDWQVGRGGFRMDWDVGQSDSLTLLGDFYKGSAGDRFAVATLTPPFMETLGGQFPIAGGNVLARWSRAFSPTSNIGLQLYYDRTERESPVHRETRDTGDLEFLHRLGLGGGQDLVWGFGYRLTTDRIRNSSTIAFLPDGREDHLFNAFVQDELTLIEKRLRLILGSKFEYNSYTRFEFQPNARLLWTPHERHTVWAAISRAVRTPSRFEHTIRGTFAVAPPLTPGCPLPVPCETAILGDRAFDSENLLAYELGYRTQLTPRLSVDITAFYHDYDDLRTFELGAPSPPPPHLIIPLRVGNKMDGEAFGVELATQWTVTNYWRLNLGYSFLKVRLEPDTSSADLISEAAEGDSPQNQFHVRSFLDLPYNLQFDAALYYVDRVSNQDVSPYTRVDARLGWHPIKNLELSLVGQNLFDRRHQEFGSGFLQNPTRIERSVYGKITWRF